MERRHQALTGPSHTHQPSSPINIPTPTNPAAQPLERKPTTQNQTKPLKNKPTTQPINKPTQTKPMNLHPLYRGFTGSLSLGYQLTDGVSNETARAVVVLSIASPVWAWTPASPLPPPSTTGATNADQPGNTSPGASSPPAVSNSNINTAPAGAVVHTPAAAKEQPQSNLTSQVCTCAGMAGLLGSECGLALRDVCAFEPQPESYRTGCAALYQLGLQAEATAAVAAMVSTACFADSSLETAVSPCACNEVIIRLSCRRSRSHKSFKAHPIDRFKPVHP